MAENNYPEYFDNEKYNPFALTMEDKLKIINININEELYAELYEYNYLMTDNKFMLWMNGINYETKRKIKIGARLHVKIGKDNCWKDYSHYKLLREYMNGLLPNSENVARNDICKIKNIFYEEKYKQYKYRPTKKISK